MSRDFNERLMKCTSFTESLSKVLFERSRNTADSLNDYERNECMPFPGPAMAGIDTAKWGVTTENYHSEVNGISFDLKAHNYQQPHQFNVAGGKLIGEIGNMAAVRFELGNYNVYPRKPGGKLVWWNRKGQIVFRTRRRYAARGHRYYHNDILRIMRESFGGKLI